MADTKILIVVKDHEAGHAYTEALSGIGVTYDIASSFIEMSCLAVENAYNGLLVDILTLVRSTKEEKIIAYECFNLYPVLRVKWENRKKKINLSPLEQAFSPDADSALKFFIESRCMPFSARSLRRHNRKNYNLSVLLSPDGQFSEQGTIKTFSLNIAPGGVFLHSTQAFELGQTVWLRFLELSDQTPIAATVCWSLEWGQSRCISGIGLRFDQLSEDQEESLNSISNG
jgi:hypothetical protein